MSNEMRQLRKEDLSLYYYLKDVVLADFVEQETTVPLSYIGEISTETSCVYEASSSRLPSPTDRGRGWVYFDENWITRCTPSCSGVPEQENRVTVYSVTTSGCNETLTPISDSDYMIDYIDGRVVTSGTVNPSYIDYYYNYIAIVDEWAAVEAADPPVVVVDIHGTDKMGYQLGAGRKTVRKVDIHVFATNPSERNDIVESLYDGLYLKSTPLYDFPNGTVLDYDGTFYGRRENMDKDATPFDCSHMGHIIGNLEFENVTARNVNLPLLMTRNRDEVMLSDLNAYRSKISFELISYTRE